MKSIQHVLWRGALALTLMAVGIGSSIGMPPVEQTAPHADCPLPTRVLVLDTTVAPAARPDTMVIVRRRPLSPAG